MEEIFEHIIKPAVEESGFGYECKRYGLGRANIVKDILEDLNKAQVVIADLSDNNPNVLWELGVRHTLKRRTILISQDKKFIPSDLKDYPVIPYDQTKAGFDKFKDDIKSKLEDIEANPDKPDSPVADFLEHKDIDILAYEKSANLRKLSALISEFSNNLQNCDVILEQVKNASKVGFSPARFSNTCLELLLSTSYIMLPKPFQQVAQFHNEMIKLINRHLDLTLEPSFRQEAEKRIKESVHTLQSGLSTSLQALGEIRVNYANDNYQEPKEPAIILSTPEHEKFLKPLE